MSPPRIPVTFTTVRPPAASVTLDLTPMSFGTTDSASYAQAFPLQWSHEIPDYQGSKSRPIRVPSIEIYEDDPKLAQAVQDRLQILKSFIYVPENQTQLGGLNRPQQLVMEWPGLYRGTVYLPRVDVVYFLFFEDRASASFGQPRAFRLTMDIREVLDKKRTAEDVRRRNDGFRALSG